MTREEAKMRAKLYSALAEGKTIQVKNSNSTWEDIQIEGLIRIYDCDKYRIKPEPKYRPFKNQAECWNEMLKHQPLGWCRDKSGGCLLMVTAISDQYVYFDGGPNVIDKTFDFYEFADGTPFGIKEK